MINHRKLELLKLNNNIPVIFNKKLNKSKARKLKFVYSDTGRVKHFIPAAQEWYNSVYAYNINYTKGLPSLDKSLMTLLNGYFSTYINHKVLDIKYISKLYRRRSPKKVFVGKGELKHTSTKTIITFYVYNTEKISLKREFRKLYKSLYNPKVKYIVLKNGNKVLTYLNESLERFIALDSNGNILKDSKGDEIITYNRPYTINEFLYSPMYASTKIKNKYLDRSFKQVTYYEIYYSILVSFIDSLSNYLKVLNEYFKYLTMLVELKVLDNNEKLLLFTGRLNNFYSYIYPEYIDYKNMADKRYKNNLYRLRYLLKFNSVKFEKPFITRLIHIVEKLYNKRVEFNIVNLKKMHLNSHILTQAIVLKLKNKKNKFFKVFKSSLNKVKLSNVNKLSESISLFDKNEYFINKVRNNNISNMFNYEKIRADNLNKLLFDFFSVNNLYGVKNSIYLKNYVFRYLKHLKLAGVRLEAKGRLSRRFTASRSIFKLNWKGGLKNVDSSFKGLSTVMLRGDAKSNVEYSMLKSKYRIGAFGIKGWISSK